MAAILPLGRTIFIDAAGTPLAGGSVTFYTPGTTTYKTTWQNADQSTANTNPIVLDSDGGALIYGQGGYQMLVLDQNGNQLWNQFTYAATISSALESFLQADSLYDAFNALGQTGASWAGDFAIDGKLAVSETIGSATYISAFTLGIPEADQLLVTNPTANATIATRTSFTVQGETAYDSNREFLSSLGFVSSKGAGVGNGAGDKVTQYIGLEAKKGTGDVWTLNTCLTMDSDSGDNGNKYTAQGYELDFNNNLADRGASGKITDDLSSPVAYGLSITGASKFSSTSALVITGSTTATDSTKPQWNRGITSAGYIGIATIHDVADVPTCIQMDGIYSNAAINLTALNGNAGADTKTALFMKNNQSINWQNNDKSKVVGDTVDTNNNRIIGVNANEVRTAAPLIPGTDNLYNIGKPALCWGDVYCASIYPGGASSGFDLGASTSPWNNLYIQNTPTVTSDPAKKKDVNPLPSVLDVVDMINPVSFRWKDQGKDNPDPQVHFGFLAPDFKGLFSAHGIDFAAYVEDEHQNKSLRTGELIPILWKAVKELLVEVRELKTALSSQS